MASRNTTRIREAKKLITEARYTFGHEQTQQERLLAEIRAYLEPIHEHDHHLTAIAKHQIRRYYEANGIEVSEDMTYAELFEKWQEAFKPIYRWYLDAPGFPCFAANPATNYIPSAEELDMRVPQAGLWNNDGTRKTYAQMEMEGLLDDAPTLREVMPDIPPGWEAIMLDRRRRYPEQYARKDERRDDD